MQSLFGSMGGGVTFFRKDVYITFTSALRTSQLLNNLKNGNVSVHGRCLYASAVSVYTHYWITEVVVVLYSSTTWAD
ncbi:MAG: hypothetical protein NC127_05375 [Muribaculum sp.]|nr:hypothetical protein [Muribaculum sp.]